MAYAVLVPGALDPGLTHITAGFGYGLKGLVRSSRRQDIVYGYSIQFVDTDGAGCRVQQGMYHE